MLIMLYLDSKVVLLPGDFYFGKQEEYQYIQTLLGSCVALTFWHPVKKIGGMCHFVIPRDVSREQQGAAKGALLNGRYGDQAIKLFQQHIALQQSDIQEYRLGLYGGMQTLKLADEGTMGRIGKINLDFARKQIRENNWSIAHSYTSGKGALKILMDLADGTVEVSTVAEPKGLT
ncbi:chemotaxis protein CheD [Thalassomonas haliotis]|uniref:Probable chemoreceptor glutamine deamidase CheD n=1 Tax=Thalassomonas haliotis TaxID=485448 RepID=A0ABY7VHD1_9GAMM|nr:chemotaxis protein CheD [Thalassomonas haliotis]WDE12873.1 chemotaxis protein CheD [Thalassomonas haliotis]